ncbi:MAG: hypothetical protein K8F91_10280 [Candidatus Obscuribacterales bacterium]|nr:hypothetical protein [Candidatus Obscuribacterales bacterium]
MFFCLLALVGCSTRAKELLSESNQWTTQQKVGELTVGISIMPAMENNNSVFITLHNKKGEPISEAEVSIRSVKQWMIKTQKPMKARYVAAGTYRIDTDMSAGASEMNIDITPRNMLTSHLRVESTIERQGETYRPYVTLF